MVSTAICCAEAHSHVKLILIILSQCMSIGIVKTLATVFFIAVCVQMYNNYKYIKIVIILLQVFLNTVSNN